MKKPLRLLILGMGLADLTGCAALRAPCVDQPRSVVVRTGDLDLSKPQGLATLRRRLENAARSVCESLDGAPLVEKMRYQRCVAQALDTAVAKHPMLAKEIFAGQSVASSVQVARQDRLPRLGCGSPPE